MLARKVNGWDYEISDMALVPSQPCVSVCMLTYQHAQFIRQAIASVLMQQTSFPIELCIGEDGSTDGTRDICVDYAVANPDKIRLFLRDRRNPARSRYALPFSYNNLETRGACRGIYVALLEGDDYWTDPLKLQKQVDLMRANPRYSMCGTGIRCVTTLPDGTDIEVDNVFRSSGKTEFRTEDFFGGFPIHASTSLMRRKFIQTPSWFGDVFNGDVCLFAMQTQHGPAGYLDEVTTTYRFHEGGVWSGKSLLERHKAFQRTSDLLNRHFAGRYEKLLRRWEHAALQDVLGSLIAQRSYGAAASLYIRSTPRVFQHMRATLALTRGAARIVPSVVAGARRLRMLLGIRTRLRRVFSTTKR
jgi:glycosyltransferase involved in cell wall biosynthesis